MRKPHGGEDGVYSYALSPSVPAQRSSSAELVCQLTHDVHEAAAKTHPNDDDGKIKRVFACRLL